VFSGHPQAPVTGLSHFSCKQRGGSSFDVLGDAVAVVHPGCRATPQPLAWPRAAGRRLRTWAGEEQRKRRLFLDSWQEPEGDTRPIAKRDVLTNRDGGRVVRRDADCNSRRRRCIGRLLTVEGNDNTALEAEEPAQAGTPWCGSGVF
jgi:hypothetical protein